MTKETYLEFHNEEHEPEYCKNCTRETDYYICKECQEEHDPKRICKNCSHLYEVDYDIAVCDLDNDIVGEDETCENWSS